jgi:hypothetical protein
MGGAPTRFDDGVEDRLDRAGTQLRDLEQRLRTLQAEEERIRGLEKNILDASARRIHDFERRLEHEWIALRQLHEEPLKTLEQRTTAITESCLNVVGEALALLRARGGPEPIAGFRAQPQRHPQPPPSEAQPPSKTRQPSEARQPPNEAQPQPNEAQPLAVPAPMSPSALGWRAAALLLLVLVAALTAFAVYTSWRFGFELKDVTARMAATEERVPKLQQLVERESKDTAQTVQRLTADALASAARAERLANLLAASDTRTYPLRGQRTAAAADGQVFFSPTRGIALNASKLPPTSSSDVYQVWMVTTRGSIGVGLVSPDAQGRIGAAFDAPPELAGNVTGFMLSLEPTGGNSKPTGPIVLAS